MKHFKLFLSAIVLSISIVFVSVSRLSAAETFWSDFNGDPALTMGSRFAKIYRNELGFPISVEDPAEFNIFNITLLRDSMQWYQNLDQTRIQDIFPDFQESHFSIYLRNGNPLLYETPYAIPDEPLTWNRGIQIASNPADSIIPSYDSDYIKALRIPAPTSLVLVAVGLLSLRFTRRWRF